MTSILKRILAGGRTGLRRVLGYPFVRQVAGAPAGPGSRRCLLVYLSLPFTRPPDHPSALLHQNVGQARMMAAALGGAGYVVDVADVRASRLPRGGGPYDLVVTHHPALEAIQDRIAESTRVVYLASGMEHAEHNRRVAARRAALEARRGCRVPPFAVNEESVSVLSRADALTGFGNAATLGTWSRVFPGPVMAFDNSGFGWIGPPPEPAPDRARHFLFFGSVDQVRKGLDLLLEAFPGLPDLHLHVAGYYEREPGFCACYERELRHTANIHAHGEIRIGSPEWEFLTRQCAFAVLPTCSEGQAGSVIQAMHAGLIPVVTPASGLNVEPYGIPLPDEPGAVLAETLARLAAMPGGELRERREATLAAARGPYSEAAFRARWDAIAAQAAALDRRTAPAHHEDKDR